MQSKTILLVEDNPDDVDLTLMAFEKVGDSPEVIVVGDGVEALDFLFGKPGVPARPLPSLVLLDLNLPRLDGLEVLRRLRADPRTALLPVVILTSSTEQRDLVESYRHRCNSYVRKPVEFTEFVEATRQLGLYWLSLNQPPPAPPEP